MSMQDFSIVRMPESTLLRRQRSKQFGGDDVFGAIEPGLGAIAVEQHALCKVFVHLVQ